MSNIFVGNLTFRTTEADICALFELYGEVQDVALVKDPLSGNSRGFAFVQMPNPTDARNAILSVNHSILGGHSLKVKAAKKPQGRGALLYPDHISSGRHAAEYPRVRNRPVCFKRTNTRWHCQ